MPEGDTIRRHADKLRPRLQGERILRAEGSAPIAIASLEGALIDAVDSTGKHLWIRLADGRAVRIHLRMPGRLRILAADHPFRATGQAARLALWTTKAIAVWFDAPVIEIVRRGEQHDHPATRTLGPDVLSATFDPRVAAERVRASNAPLGVAVLDQSRAAGLGNVYKSELLFLCGLDPRAPASAFALDDLTALFVRAAELMRLNLDDAPRATRLVRGRKPMSKTAPRYYVYRRGGMPCPTCGNSIERIMQGTSLPRSTYFCPRCQRAPEPGAAP